MMEYSAIIMVILKGVKNVMEFIENTANEDDITPEFLEARNAVRQALVDMANKL